MLVPRKYRVGRQDDPRLSMVYRCKRIRCSTTPSRRSPFCRLACRSRTGIGGLRLEGFGDTVQRLTIPLEQVPTRASDACEAVDDFEPYSNGAIDAPYATQDSARSARVTSLTDAADLAIREGMGENSMWNLARAIKAMESTTEIPLEKELGAALSVWWAKTTHSDEDDFECYLTDLMDCYSRVKMPLGSNALRQQWNACRHSMRRFRFLSDCLG